MFQDLETDRLILKILKNDAASMVLSFYEENHAYFEPWEPKRSTNFYSLYYQKASLSAEYHQMTEGKLLRYWIFLKDNPREIVGTFCFQNILKTPYESCILGYKFSRKYLHQGYAQESIRKGIEFILSARHIHRIEAYIMPTNEPSLRLIERLGFRYEGISYSFAKVNDSWANHKRYSLINTLDN